MLLLGILNGMADIPVLKEAGLILSDVFIRIFRFISLPIIALSLIVTLSSYSAEGAMKKIWQRIIFYTLFTTIVAAIVSSLLYLFIQPANVNSVPVHPLLQGHHTPYFQHLATLIPANIFTPFMNYQVITVLLMGMVFGIAIRFIPEEGPRLAIIHFFKGLHGIFLVITKWVVAIIPLGLFGFITTTVVQLKAGMSIGGIGQYLLVVVLANIIQGLVVLPIWLRTNQVRPFVTLRKMMPALSIAFFSKSSSGSLPITMKTAEDNLLINPKITRFVLPLCTSINMNGCAAFIFATVIYLMQNYGIEITFTKMLIWVFIATVAAVGNAGVPMGCFFLSASLLSSMNIPITLMGLILPFYSLIDMLETSLNVWSDTCITTVISSKMTTESQQQEQVVSTIPEAIQ